jgi:hypothetical protein
MAGFRLSFAISSADIALHPGTLLNIAFAKVTLSQTTDTTHGECCPNPLIPRQPDRG